MDESKFHIIEGRTFCVPCGREARTIQLFTSTDYHCDYCEANPGSFDEEEVTEPWGDPICCGVKMRRYAARTAWECYVCRAMVGDQDCNVKTWVNADGTTTFVCLLTALFLFIAACSPPDRFTWGEAMSETITAWCERLEECGIDPPHCYRHSIMHACELDGVCSEPLGYGAVENTDSCVEAISDEFNCVKLVWALPGECRPILEMDPRREQ